MWGISSNLNSEALLKHDKLILYYFVGSRNELLTQPWHNCHLFIKTMWQTTRLFTHLHIEQMWGNISVDSQAQGCFWQAGKCKSKIHSPLVLFGLHQLRRGNIWLLSFLMLCSPASWFPTPCRNSTVRLNYNTEVEKTKTKVLKSSKTLPRSDGNWGDKDVFFPAHSCVMH